MIDRPQPDADRLIAELRTECMNNEQFLDLLVHKIADVAVDKVERTNSRSRNRLGLLITIGSTLFLAAITGVATFGFSSLRQIVETQAVTEAAGIATMAADKAAIEAVDRVVGPKVDEVVAAKVADAEASWQRANRAFQLVGLSQRIEDNKGYSEEEARRAIDLLSGFANDDEYKEFAQFPTILEKFVEHFVGTARDDLVQRLERLFGDVMLETWGIAFTMTQSLGYELIGFPALPRELGAGRLRSEWEAKLERYHAYADASRRLLYPESPYVFDIVLGCMEQAPDAEMKVLIGRSEPMSKQELESVRITLASLVPSASAEADAAARRVSERVFSCLSAYQDLDPAGVLTVEASAGPGAGVDEVLTGAGEPAPSPW